jgi:serine/threonine protein kinase
MLESYTLQGRYIFTPSNGNTLYNGGHHCRVYLGFDIISERQIAIKVLSSSFTESAKNIERAKREASVRIQHPNLLEMLDFVVDSQTGSELYHLISEYIPGITLAESLKIKSTGLSLDEALEIFDGICEGLKRLHNNEPSIIHRGLDPSNIVLMQEDQQDSTENELNPNRQILTPKIMDYGMVKLALHETSGLTTPGDFVETTIYVAREVVLGEHTSDDLSPDVFSLAVVLYEMLSGNKPFSEHVALQLQEEKARFRYKKIGAVSDALNLVLKKSLSPAPKKRYRTIEAFQKAVHEAQVQVSPTLPEIQPRISVPVQYPHEAQLILTDKPIATNSKLQNFKVWLFNLDQPDEKININKIMTMNTHGDAIIMQDFFNFILRLVVLILPLAILLGIIL